MRLAAIILRAGSFLAGLGMILVAVFAGVTGLLVPGMMLLTLPQFILWGGPVERKTIAAPEDPIERQLSQIKKMYMDDDRPAWEITDEYEEMIDAALHGKKFRPQPDPMYKDTGKPGGIITSDKAVSQETFGKIKQQWQMRMDQVRIPVNRPGLSNHDFVQNAHRISTLPHFEEHLPTGCGDIQLLMPRPDGGKYEIIVPMGATINQISRARAYCDYLNGYIKHGELDHLVGRHANRQVLEGKLLDRQQDIKDQLLQSYTASSVSQKLLVLDQGIEIHPQQHVKDEEFQALKRQLRHAEEELLCLYGEL